MRNEKSVARPDDVTETVPAGTTPSTLTSHSQVNRPISRKSITSRQRPDGNRKGAIIAFTAIMLIAMMAMLAFSVDTGYMYTMQTQLQRSVDSAALAGASALVDGNDAATDMAIEYLVRNPVGNSAFTTIEDLEQKIAAFTGAHQDDIEVTLGNWNPETKQVDPVSELPTTISVRMEYKNQPLFFGGLLGRSTFDIAAESVAMYQPRDIMLVLDLSASMNDDSEFKSFSALGENAVKDNLQQIYGELGSPTYGNLEFEPRYLKVNGAPPSHPSLPQITVEYRYHSVHVTSTKDLSNVVLEYYNGYRQKFDGLSGTTGTFAGTGYYYNYPIYKVWVKSGSNDSGDGPGYGEYFSFTSSTINSTIKNAFGLNNVPYPYPSGSWDSYIDYCRSGYSSNQNNQAGYRYKFGYMNLINYWLDSKPRHSQTPDLWKVSAQPIGAVKDAVGVFMDYIKTVNSKDQVGLVIYNASTGNGLVEHELTSDYDAVMAKVTERQAGHYHSYTNIGAGMQWARSHLDQHGRPGAFKMIVLMTDGKANWVNGGYSTYYAKEYVLNEAHLSAERKYPIVTISLGAGADQSLMDDVAEITDSRHFNIPGGQSVSQYQAELLEVFRDIADDHPLQIVK